VVSIADYKLEGMGIARKIKIEKINKIKEKKRKEKRINIPL
jgi:hypothetical protein